VPQARVFRKGKSQNPKQANATRPLNIDHSELGSVSMVRLEYSSLSEDNIQNIRGTKSNISSARPEHHSRQL
jgi:hypothetical protein